MKKKDAKRKLQQAIKTREQSLRFQTWWGKIQKMPNIPDDSPWVNAELDAICKNGLAADMLTLKKIVDGVQQALGCLPEADRGSLNGAVVPYLLGIVTAEPVDNQPSFTFDKERMELPLQVTIYYDNDVRNQVVDWVKEHYGDMTTRLGQPILKLHRMTIEFRRRVKTEKQN